MSAINYLNSAVRISAGEERCIQQHASNQAAVSLISLMCWLSLGLSAAALLLGCFSKMAGSSVLLFGHLHSPWGSPPWDNLETRAVAVACGKIGRVLVADAGSARAAEQHVPLNKIRSAYYCLRGTD